MIKMGILGCIDSGLNSAFESAKMIAEDCGYGVEAWEYLLDELKEVEKIAKEELGRWKEKT